jgi:hypothetical protein
MRMVRALTRKVIQKGQQSRSLFGHDLLVTSDAEKERRAAGRWGLPRQYQAFRKKIRMRLLLVVRDKLDFRFIGKESGTNRHGLKLLRNSFNAA